jgi:hypothetical protein
VSEPVKIHWKKDMDLTHGVTNAAVTLWESSKKLSNGTIGMSKARGTPEYDALVKKLESSDMSMSSFFTLFSYISAKRFVTAEESAKANAAETERRKKRAAGDKVEEPVEDEAATEDVDTMVCPYGDDLASFLAEDLFPNAIKYFSKSQPGPFLFPGSLLTCLSQRPRKNTTTSRFRRPTLRWTISATTIAIKKSTFAPLSRGSPKSARKSPRLPVMWNHLRQPVFELSNEVATRTS